MKTSAFYLVFTAYFTIKAVTQVTVTEQVDDEDDTSVFCLSNRACATLDIAERGGPFVGCCDEDGCIFRTTCVESGIVFGELTLECTGNPLSRCGTRTWGDISATAYFCATSRTTQSLIRSKDPLATSDPTDDNDDDDATEYDSTTDHAPPTLSVPPKYSSTSGYAPTSTSDGDDNDDDGDPGMDWEHDLSWRQRVGAGIGSGVIGGLLLIFFGIFGCWRGPGRGELHPKTQQDQLPDENPAMQRRVTNGVTMEETQPSASWTSSPIDIQSPQPLHPQPPYYSTSDIPGSSMGYRNPQYQ
ncbi:hypothetical protein CDV36_013674 [Fusarium kuroshium]|uniref:Extracellular membrane protein CFEM domain-containing protein n=1 Tax=Fusarium kuroshium TaxID=2010991 RepID=A0A3M2RND8_9HYPO|nr:hypothetical protein CDV36_013674 [Fusarium kuroshium]